MHGPCLPTAGIGLKPEHFVEALAAPAAGTWFEVHAENYMVDGGPRLAMLEEARQSCPLSLHGVGMSLAGADLPNADHLARLKTLVDRFEPFLVSEHLAWSRLGMHCFPDLLPCPRDAEALALICRNIDHVQSILGREILIENPTHYMHLLGHEWSEPAFLGEIVRRTGCRILLDLNNVHVSSVNLGLSETDYLAEFPIEHVDEIHIAGHSSDCSLSLLIDDHGSRVSASVLSMLCDFLEHHGPRPVLVEWDRNLPDYAELAEERDKAAALIAAVERSHTNA